MRPIPAIAVTALLATVFLSACAPIERQAAFIESEYLPYRSEGDCTIHGQAFLRTRDGEVKLSAGLPIVLTPVTSYSTEWFEKEILGHGYLTPPDPREAVYIRTTIADAEGRFTFDSVPAGSYFLTCDIDWELPDGTWEGAIAYAAVDLSPSQTKSIVLTRPPAY